MGFLNRLLGRSKERQQHAAPNENKPRDQWGVSSYSGVSLVKLSGTTTVAKDASVELAGRHGAGARGHLELSGSMQREPDNEHDPHAVAVHVEGDRIGYLPSYVARDLKLSTDGARAISVQLFTEITPKGLRVEAWAWLGEGKPQWEWSEAERPPMSPQAKAHARQASVGEMVDGALAGGGDRARDFAAGLVKGTHYLQLSEPIKQLKRENRLEEALVLCYAAIEGAEASAALDRREPAPWYTEQAAIVHRKLGQRSQEIEVLKRWLQACPPDRGDGSRISERLKKLVS